MREVGHGQDDVSLDATLLELHVDGVACALENADTDVRGGYPEGFHLGFLLDDPESVRALHARAREGGADVSDVIVNGRATLLFFTAPEGYRVEVSCQRTSFV